MWFQLRSCKACTNNVTYICSGTCACSQQQTQPILFRHNWFCFSEHWAPWLEPNVHDPYFQTIFCGSSVERGVRNRHLYEGSTVIPMKVEVWTVIPMKVQPSSKRRWTAIPMKVQPSSKRRWTVIPMKVQPSSKRRWTVIPMKGQPSSRWRSMKKTLETNAFCNRHAWRFNRHPDEGSTVIPMKVQPSSQWRFNRHPNEGEPSSRWRFNRHPSNRGGFGENPWAFSRKNAALQEALKRGASQRGTSENGISQWNWHSICQFSLLLLRQFHRECAI